MGQSDQTTSAQLNGYLEVSPAWRIRIRKSRYLCIGPCACVLWTVVLWHVLHDERGHSVVAREEFLLLVVRLSLEHASLAWRFAWNHRKRETLTSARSRFL